MTQSPFDPPTSYGLSYTTPSSERPRRSTPLSAVVVISLLIGALTGGISGWLAADFFQNFSGNNSNQTAVSNETNQAQNNAAQLPAIKPLEGSIPAIVQVVQPSVVSISASGAGGTGTGSGFIYRPDGYIITNNHVISTAAGSGEIEVTLFDRSSYPARLIGRNSSYDLAVLKIEKEGLIPLSIGNSDQLQVGDSTIAFGSPLGLVGTVTSGIVSALNRPVTAGGVGDQSYISAIQTDAAINPGNSGGPLVNAAAEVVGVNSAIATLGVGASGSIGLGFAIPITQVERILQEIIASGVSSTPIAGISVDSTFEGTGARVAEVVVGGPSENSGLSEGDVITKIDGEFVDDSIELIVAIRRNDPGDTVTFTATSPSGEEKSVTVTLGSREEG
ncbi:MAG: S1C family serine protease [Candidatus Nanopelagicales bacterium]